MAVKKYYTVLADSGSGKLVAATRGKVELMTRAEANKIAKDFNAISKKHGFSKSAEVIELKEGTPYCVKMGARKVCKKFSMARGQ